MHIELLLTVIKQYWNFSYNCTQVERQRERDKERVNWCQWRLYLENKL